MVSAGLGGARVDVAAGGHGIVAVVAQATRGSAGAGGGAAGPHRHGAVAIVVPVVVAALVDCAIAVVVFVIADLGVAGEFFVVSIVTVIADGVAWWSERAGVDNGAHLFEHGIIAVFIVVIVTALESNAVAVVVFVIADVGRARVDGFFGVVAVGLGTSRAQDAARITEAVAVTIHAGREVAGIVVL